MLIYEKKIENQETQEMERHLFGTMANVPSDDDSEITYDPSGLDLTVTSKLLDDGHGGMNLVVTGESGEELTPVEVWIGDNNIIPGNIEKEIESISATTDKTYFVGDTISASDFTVTASYSDGTSATITEGFTVDPTTAAADTTKVTVTVDNTTISTEVAITVQEVTVTSISASPETIQVTSGSELSIDDIVVTAHYNNGSTSTIEHSDAGITFSPAAGTVITESGDLTISYNELQTTIAIIVITQQ